MDINSWTDTASKFFIAQEVNYLLRIFPVFVLGSINYRVIIFLINTNNDIGISVCCVGWRALLYVNAEDRGNTI